MVKLLERDDQTLEKQACFDLLDSLTKSGAFGLEADVHAVLALSHSFDLNVMDTLVRGNLNPIEKLERATVTMATKIFGRNEDEICSRPK